MSYLELRAEKIGVNDNEYEIIETHFENGDFVEEGIVIAIYETSKSLIELITPKSGYVYYNCHEEDDIDVGSVIAYLSEDSNFTIPKEEVSNVIQSNTLVKDIVQSYNDSDDAVYLSKTSEMLVHRLENIKKELPNECISHLFLTKYIINKIFNLPFIDELYDNRIVIHGAGRFASVIIDAIKRQNIYKIVGIIDDTKDIGTVIDGVEILGGEGILGDLLNQGINNAVIGFGAIGIQYKRQEVFDMYVNIGFNMPNIIHPDSYISDNVIMGNGNVILSQVNVGPCVVIENNCLLNVNSLVSHHCELSDNVQLSPGAIIAGSVKINNNVVMGMGTTTTFGISIGNNTIVNNGVSVYKDISSNTVVKS